MVAEKTVKGRPLSLRELHLKFVEISQEMTSADPVLHAQNAWDMVEGLHAAGLVVIEPSAKAQLGDEIKEGA